MNLKVLLYQNKIKIILILFILSSYIINLFIVNELIKAIIALPHLFLFPYSIGCIIYHLYQYIFKELEANKEVFFFRMIILWIIGLLIILLISLITQLFKIFSITILSVFFMMLYLLGIILDNLISKVIIKRKKFSEILISLLIALIPLIILKIFTSFPGSYSVVIYRFNYISQSIIQRNIIILDELTFYMPIFPLLISYISNIFILDTLSLFWIAPFLIEIIFFLGMYHLMNHIFKNRFYALLVSIVSLYILFWNSHYLFPPIFELQPRSALLSIYPVIFYFIYKFIDKIRLEEFKKSAKNIFKLHYTFAMFIISFVIMFLTKNPEIADRGLYMTIVITFGFFLIPLGIKILKTDKYTLFSLSFLFLFIPLLHSYESLFYFLVFILIIYLKLFELIFKKYSKKNFNKLLNYSIIFLLIFLILYSFGIIKISLSLFELTSFLIHPNPFVNPLASLLELIIWITIPSAILVIITILKILRDSESRILSRQFLLVFIILIFIYVFPLKEIARIGCVFIVFINYFLILSFKDISEVLHKFLD